MKEGQGPTYREGSFKPIFGWHTNPITEREEKMKQMETCQPIWRVTTKKSWLLGEQGKPNESSEAQRLLALAVLALLIQMEHANVNKFGNTNAPEFSLGCEESEA
jgi:hypothetical protein